MAGISQIEQAKIEIAEEFEDILTASGYRTDAGNQVRLAIRPLDQIKKFPEIGVELGDARLEPVDGDWGIFQLNADVWVQGAVTADTDTGTDAENISLAAEMLRHDIMRRVAEVMRDHVVDTGMRWFLTPVQPIRFSTLTLLGEKRNKGVFYCTFRVVVGHMTDTLAYTEVGLLTEAGEHLHTEDGYELIGEQTA